MMNGIGLDCGSYIETRPAFSRGNVPLGKMASHVGAGGLERPPSAGELFSRDLGPAAAWWSYR